MKDLNNKKELGEAKALRWLANMFPLIDDPKDNEDKINNIINLYCATGADKLEELSEKINCLEEEIRILKIQSSTSSYDYGGYQGGAYND